VSVQPKSWLGRLAVAIAGGVALAVWPIFFLLQGGLGAFVDQAFLFNTQIYAKYLDVHLLDPVALLWQTLSFGRHRFSFVVDWLAGQGTDATVATFASAFELALLVVLVGLIVARRRSSICSGPHGDCVVRCASREMRCANK